MSEEILAQSLWNAMKQTDTVLDQANGEIARLRAENERLTAWARRAYEAMCRYDESLMVSCVADAPPQVREES